MAGATDLDLWRVLVTFRNFMNSFKGNKLVFMTNFRSMEMPKKVRPIFKYKFDIKKVNDQVKKIKENYIRRNQVRYLFFMVCIGFRQEKLASLRIKVSNFCTSDCCNVALGVRNHSYHLRKPNLFSKIVLPPQKAK